MNAVLRFAGLTVGIVGLVAGMASLVGSRFTSLRPPVLSTLPPFRLVTNDAEEFSKEQLAGTVSLVHFFFSTCHDVCPATFGRLAAIERDLPPSLRVLSISIDPDRDTPAVLTEYRKRFAPGRDRWIFATGALPQITDLAERGFMVAIGPAKELHSARVFLVDGSAALRGIYQVDEEAERSRLQTDADALVREQAESASVNERNSGL